MKIKLSGLAQEVFDASDLEQCFRRDGYMDNTGESIPLPKIEKTAASYARNSADDAATAALLSDLCGLESERAYELAKHIRPMRKLKEMRLWPALVRAAISSWDGGRRSPVVQFVIAKAAGNEQLARRAAIAALASTRT